MGRNSIIDFMIEAGHEITQIASLTPRQLQHRPFTSQRCQQYLKQLNRKLAAKQQENATSVFTSSSGIPHAYNSENFIYNKLAPLSAETINTGQNLLPEQRAFQVNPFSAASRSQQAKPQSSLNTFPTLGRYQPYQVKDYSHGQAHQHHHHGYHQSQSTLQQMPSQSQSSLSSPASSLSSSSPSSPSSSSPPSNARRYFVFDQLYVRTYLDEQKYVILYRSL